MINPMISVITVCYNSQQTIERTLKSVISQSYTNWEYIIVDGGSSDKTVALCQKYKEQTDNKVIIISENDEGIYDAMNKGIRNASGELIAILNSDDWYEPDALRSIAEIAETQESNSFIIYGMCNIIQNECCVISGLLHPSVLDHQMMYHPAIFLTKKVYESVGTFNTAYPIAADYDLMIRCRKADLKFIPAYKVITNFSSGGASDNQRAYYDLIKVQLNNGIISKNSYCLRKTRIFLREIEERIKLVLKHKVR